MGWSSANPILEEVALALHKEFGNTLPASQTTILSKLIRVLEEGDADCLEECQGVTTALDEALRANDYHVQGKDCEWIEVDDGEECACGYKVQW